MNKRLKSFVYAGRGIRAVFASEANMKIHLTIMLLVVIFGFVFQLSAMEWIACVLCFGLVAGMEMINTAIESVVDLVSPEKHPLAAKAKDIAAGAVLVCAIISVVVGVIVFLPKIIDFVICIVNNANHELKIAE